MQSLRELARGNASSTESAFIQREVERLILLGRRDEAYTLYGTDTDVTPLSLEAFDRQFPKEVPVSVVR